MDFVIFCLDFALDGRLDATARSPAEAFEDFWFEWFYQIDAVRLRL